MITFQQFFIFLFLTAALIASCAGIFMFMRYKTLLAAWGGAFLLAVGFDLLSYTLVLTSGTDELRQLYYRVYIFSFLCLLMVWLRFISIFSGHKHWINWRSTLLGGVIPALLMVSLLGHPNLDLNWGSQGRQTIGTLILLTRELGWIGTLFNFYATAIGILSLVLLAQMLPNTNRYFRALTLALFFGELFILLAVLFDATSTNPFAPISNIQLGYTFSSLLAFWFAFGLDAGGIIPIARTTVFEYIQDGVIVLNNNGAVVDLNPTAVQIVGKSSKELVGKPVSQVWQEGTEYLTTSTHGIPDKYVLWINGLEKTFDIQASPITEEISHENLGHVLVLRDVTGREKLETDLHTYSQELSRTNTLITALSVITSRVGASSETDLMLHTLGSEIRKLGFECGIVTLDPACDEATIRYLSFNPTVIRTVEKLAGVSVINYAIPRRYWPDDRALTEKIPIWYSETVTMLRGMFPEIPEIVAQKALQLFGFKPETQLCMLPLISRDEMIGAMLIWGNDLRPADSKILEVFASQVAGILQNAITHENETKRANELARSNAMILALSRVASRLGNSASPDLVLAGLGSELQKLDLDCGVVTIDPAGEAATIQFVSFRPSLIMKMENLLGFTVKGHVVPKRYWPGERILKAKAAAWYSNPQKTLLNFFPNLPKSLANRIFQLLNIRPESEICILPLLINDQVTGAMLIWGAGLIPEDNPSLSVFASQVAAIFQNANAFENETHKAEELTRSNAIILALSTVSARLDTTSDLPQVFETLGHELKKIQVNCMVGTLENANQELKLEYISFSREINSLVEKFGISLPKEIKIPRRLWPTDKAVVEKTPYWDPDMLSSTIKMFPYIPREVFIKSFEILSMDPKNPVCYLPMISEDDVIGIMAVWGSDIKLDDIPGFSVFANQVATAIKNTRLYDRAQKEIIEKTQAEIRTRTALAEKEVLLKEVHHRVKNNLQIISSLLNLQSGQIADPITKDALRESQNRVRTMALIHEKLYQSSDLAQIDFAAYLKSLGTFLAQSYRGSSSKVVMQIDAQDIRLNIDTAIPCGLIVNELVSNSLKYAFPENRAGNIKIEFYQPSNGNFILLVTDDGAGLPDGFEPAQSQSLGLKLVNSLVLQLKGTLMVDTMSGVSYKISFSTS